MVKDGNDVLEKFQKKKKIIVLDQEGYKSLCNELRSENGCDEVITGLWEKWFNKLKEDKNYQLLIKDGTIQGNWNINSLSLSTHEVENIVKTINTKNDFFFVLFDRHGDVMQKRTEFDNDSRVLYYEPYNNTEPIYPFMSFPLSIPLIKKRMVYEMLEAGITKILIVDERIQERLDESRGFGRGDTELKLLVMQMLNYMNIFVPPKSNINLEKPDKNKITDWIRNHPDSLFLVIHQGIMDEMGLEKKEEAEKWIDEIEEIVPYLVITSGRGKPPNIAHNARFEHLSGILRYTIETKSKLHLTKLLFSSRRG